jgi:hypothetical protein
MQSQDYAAWWSKWSSDMAADSGGTKVDVGPVQALGARPGRRTPKRNSQRSRVPAYSAGQTRKL